MTPTRHSLLSATIFAVAFIACTSAAYAGRAPTDQELLRIDETLKQLGYTGWESIETEDSGTKWEIDNAVGPDGEIYDLELDFNTRGLIKKEKEDE